MPFGENDSEPAMKKHMAVFREVWVELVKWETMSAAWLASRSCEGGGPTGPGNLAASRCSLW